MFWAVALLLSACTAVQPTAAGAAAESGKLAQIQAAGKLVAGTSADYPPYESIDENGNFVGFDMDLDPRRR
ncbi:MAG UNVERIFIED_CONTAM: transporter substrate-binding domain-containing protein [Rickettsiaceae bacterium]